MSPEEQQRWAEKAGKGIEEANRIVKERIEQMKKAGVFENNNVVGYPETELIELKEKENKMEWFPGGIF
jgi:ribosomal protein S2